jgi:hypothetical protein
MASADRDAGRAGEDSGRFSNDGQSLCSYEQDHAYRKRTRSSIVSGFLAYQHYTPDSTMNINIREYFEFDRRLEESHQL